MKELENILIYPYNEQFTPILRNTSFVKSYNKIYLSSLSGWGFCNEDAGYVDGGDNLGIIVDNRFEEYFNECETVMFVDPDYPIDYDKFIYPRIYKAIDKGKNIICLINLKDKLHEIKKYCEIKKVSFKNYSDSNLDTSTFAGNNIEENEILDLNTPIISVVGLSDNTDKFALQLEIKTELEDMGYKVSYIGSREYCEFFGAHSFPKFMFDKNMSESDKIYLFNKLVKYIETKENPDVIIIGVPGGILPHNKKISNNFGITAYEVFQSITSDALVLSVFHEEYNEKFFKSINNNIKYRFGIEIDVINILNKKVDWGEMMAIQPKKISCTTINKEYLKESVAQLKSLTQIPIYNLHDKTNNPKITEILVNKLEENVAITYL